MVAVIIPRHTVVTIGDVPVSLAVDTIVETAFENMALLTGYHYAQLPEDGTPQEPTLTIPITNVER